MLFLIWTLEAPHYNISSSVLITFILDIIWVEIGKYDLYDSMVFMNVIGQLLLQAPANFSLCVAHEMRHHTFQTIK